ncbi:OLC1v1029503C3 [Oldenlandia corymbosa var. corymbosa]|uniref:OLC1v1029503C3 n=1 Tax=Oldenlandia corymbosa var. corymbosa TaxID=529605 RepID=A0AAV1CEQ2_OLDCO|nr:OLC1v1029503C3 [Oldenlandia corymbosa var. corymbosa]
MSLSSSAPASSSTAAPADVSSSSEERKDEPEMMHKVKVIQFLGRTTPIILQNDNGPCPLLAICNVLLLKNNLSLSPDIPEVSQQKLLSLVADRIFESNSNTDNKDAGYVENQEQNIADAIDLLPRLTTGIDVNIKFRRIDDFEFTRECAIFDLLDIPLYHGWIVDPQDCETANAIGSRSYNTLMGDLVALDTQNLETGNKKPAEEDSVDFVAATTAALGVPSPSLSRGRSFDDPSVSPEYLEGRKGDVEEEAEVSGVMKLSESVTHTSPTDDLFLAPPSSSLDTDSVLHINNSESVSFVADSKSQGYNGSQIPCLDTVITPNSSVTFNKDSETVSQEAICLSFNTELGDSCDQSQGKAPSENVEKDVVKTPVDMNGVSLVSSLSDSAGVSESNVHISENHEVKRNLSDSTSEVLELGNRQNGHETSDATSVPSNAQDTDLVNGRQSNVDEREGFSSSVNDCEPIYEGEENILESRATSNESREPVYEGEVVLAEQGIKNLELSDTKKDEISPTQGELIRNFLKCNASQLTIYGLFCLQEGLKERELCVFFRNNHFNTMFKFEGELYILATDLGYLNQPELVWEKLNEVNGDTVFMTGNFKEFKVEHQDSSSWDEQNAMTSTADYLSSIDNSMQEDSSFNSDLQLAIALQQQEFEQQTQQQQNNSQQPSSLGGGRLVTGPQVCSNIFYC